MGSFPVSLKSLLIAVSLSAVGTALPASAADVLPVAPGSIPYAAYNWTGVYTGFNAGGGFATASATASLAGFSASASENLVGFVGGGQIGFNWQISSIVVGIEGDFQGASQNNSTAAGFATTSDTIDWFGTVRGRVGVAIDRWMPYFTAGWGYGDIQSSVSSGVSGTLSANSAHSVWVAGGGLEVGVWGNVTAKLEYLYLDTGTITNNYSTFLGTLAVNTRVKDNVVRAGLNYRF
jgi:outer membrane immunogenic protein